VNHEFCFLVSGSRGWRVPIITLTTDFGTADGFVGAMKGVILSIAPASVGYDLSKAGTETQWQDPPPSLHLPVPAHKFLKASILI